MANRSRAYIRYQRRNHINRKKRIIKNQCDYWYYEFEGVLSKGKIHCSCPICRRKSYDKASRADIRKAIRAVNDLVDNGYGNDLIQHIYNRTKGIVK